MLWKLCAEAYLIFKHAYNITANSGERSLKGCVAAEEAALKVGNMFSML